MVVHSDLKQKILLFEFYPKIAIRKIEIVLETPQGYICTWSLFLRDVSHHDVCTNSFGTCLLLLLY